MNQQYQIPDHLIQEILRGNCVLCVGAGLSQGASLPSWPALLQLMTESGDAPQFTTAEREELHRYIDEGDLLTVAEELRERMPLDAFRRFMLSIFRKSGIRPTAVHAMLNTIPFAAVATTNYDTLLETSYTLSNGYPPPTFTHKHYPELAAAAKGGEFFIVKLHGTIDDIESIVLGRQDYQNLLHRNPAYYSFMQSLLLTKTVLFIGYSLSDPDILLLLGELRAHYGGYLGRHFALIDTSTTPPIKQRRFSRDFGVEIIPYTASAPSHPEVQIVLSLLHDSIYKHRVAISSAAIDAPVPSSTTLSDEITDWLESIGYQVSPWQPLDGRMAMAEARLNRGSVNQAIRVHCTVSEITSSDVNRLARTLDLRVPSGWIITDRRISPTARTVAATLPSTRVFTLSEFLEAIVWYPYFAYLREKVDVERIQSLYVDPSCSRQFFLPDQVLEREIYPSLDVYIDEWSRERSSTPILLLGDFGSGKTWFTHHYAIRQLERYLEDPVNQRLPLVIPLRIFVKATTIQQLMNDVLLEQYGLSFVGSAYEHFVRMNQRGKLLLLLDGFDEMASRTTADVVSSNFKTLLRVVSTNSKVVICSRAELFRSMDEIISVASAIVDGPPSSATERMEVIHIEPFTDKQMIMALEKRLTLGYATEKSRSILASSQLTELARKPVVLSLLLEILHSFTDDEDIDLAAIYLHATNGLLVRNIRTGRTFTSVEDKLFFLRELAWEMLSTGKLRIHYTELPERIHAYFRNQVGDRTNLDYWEYDLRGQTLLHSGGDGFYQFAHLSFAEYFAAAKLAKDLNVLNPYIEHVYEDK